MRSTLQDVIILHLSTPVAVDDTYPHHVNTWRPYANARDFNANVATILIILVCALVCALALNAAIRYLIRHSRLPNPVDDPVVPAEASQAASASKATMAPTLVFSSGINLAGARSGTEAECSICLSEFVNGEEIRVLPRCKHGYHVKCIHHWLSLHASCPTCRTSCLANSTSQHHHSLGNGVSVESPLPQRALDLDLEQPSQPQS